MGVGRPYTQRLRAESAAQTRRRMVDAARGVLLAGEVVELSLPTVARLAGVSRSTLYDAFGSKAGLVTAVFRETLDRAGYQNLVELITLPDPVEALEAGLAYACHVYLAEYAVLRRLSLLAQLDPESGTVLQESDRGRAESMRWMAGRLAENGRLRDGVTAETAAALLWTLTSFGTFEQLHSGWGLDAAACGDQLTFVMRASLLRA